MSTKQVIVIRKDLKMRKGKTVSQGSHASMAFLTRRLIKVNTFFQLFLCIFTKKSLFHVLLKPVEVDWMRNSFAKICVSVNSEEELLELHNKAKERGLESHLIEDSGRTEFHGVKTNTCIAIGPDKVENFIGITDELQLL